MYFLLLGLGDSDTVPQPVFGRSAAFSAEARLIEENVMSLTDHLPRFPLAFLPTPIQPLLRLSKKLGGPALWIKRDDLTGLAGGGNKTRKLEFLVGAALAAGADSLITTGAIQSNHCRQTAAAAASAGLHCHLVLSGQPPEIPVGNLLLDRLLGAEIIWCEPHQRMARLAALADELRASGGHPYAIPYGGSDPVGAAGYALAAEELHFQVRERGLSLDAVVIPSSSGGTQAGLIAGCAAIGWQIPIIGVSIEPAATELSHFVAGLATSTAARLGTPCGITESEVLVDDGFLGDGYAVMGDLEREAIFELARTEGILVDPVYTGRAFGALLAWVRGERFSAGQSILFWHTGGTAAIQAYAPQLVCETQTEKRHGQEIGGIR